MKNEADWMFQTFDHQKKAKKMAANNLQQKKRQTNLGLDPFA